MRKNRKRSKRMSVVASHTMHVFGVMLVLFVMVILNMLASSRCTQLQTAIGEKQRQLARLEKDRERESGRWDCMCTLDRLEDALLKHGLNMKYTKPIQTVLMDSAGQPLVAQSSVREARRRQGVIVAAAEKSAVPTVRTTSAPPSVRRARRARR